MNECIKICVDCVKNDPVDIKAGGPEYLGFDFFVRIEEAEEIKLFISECLNKYGIPLVNIYYSGMCSLNDSNVWDELRIEDCISKNAELYITSSERYYRGR